MKRPVIGIVMDQRTMDNHITYLVLAKYVTAVTKFSQITPILLPPIVAAGLIQNWLGLIDGLFLTGSPSDIHPSRYGDEIKNPQSFFDENRDETSLGLIKGAIKLGIPVLGICRGFQEINVALGGTLHQSIHRNPNYMDHRESHSDDLNVLYDYRHSVTAEPGGRLIKIVKQDKWQVNSLHDQGIDLLAPDLQVEARAEDGLIEAISLKDTDKFVVAAQWHFEWGTASNECSTRIFKAFGNACTHYQSGKKI
jgi:putative glutamine amidotransferase